MPRISACILALILLLVLSCGSSSKQVTPQPTAAPTPSTAIVLKREAALLIGVSAALTGDQMASGSDIADGADLALADHGGSLRDHPLKILRMDDGCSDAEKSVAVAAAFSSTPGLTGVVGPMCTTGAQAADAVYEAARIAHILPAATRTDLSRQGEAYFFRTAWRDDAQASVQAAYAINNLRLNSAVLIDDGDPYGKALADAFTTSFAAAGGRILSRERIERGATDFSPVARQVKSSDPSLVVFEGLNPEGTLTLKALREAGYAGTFIAGDGVLNARDFLVAGGTATEGAILTGGAAPDSGFVARFHGRFQRNPITPFVLQSHDAASALLSAIDAVAIERSDGTLVIDRVKLADKLRGQQFAGLTGSIQFDEHGDRRGDTPSEAGVAIYRVANGRFEVIR